MSLTIPVSANDHAQGPLDAPAVLVEYGDYQCPKCAQAYPVVKAIQERFEGAVCLVFRNMPMTQVHPYAQLAAEAAEAAGAQGKFWEMHDALYENQRYLGRELIGSLARELKLDIALFENNLAAHRFRQRVRRDFMGGIRSGVNGTPTFFINGERYNGHLEELALTVQEVIGDDYIFLLRSPQGKPGNISRGARKDRQG
jgi:protein-disulfide isomerase